MPPVEVIVDVSGRIGIEGTHHVSTWVFLPDNPRATPPVLFCLPGGSYSKAYWHLEVPNHPGYSFGEHIASKGMVVVAVDHLGVGDSSRHPRAVDLLPEVVAAANSIALNEILDAARSGKLIDDLPALRVGPVVGVGHSMGAMLAIYQQSLHDDFDAIAPLGYGVLGAWFNAQSQTAPSLEAVLAGARSGAMDLPIAPDRSLPSMRHHFYWDDVPAAVIAADDLTSSPVPGVTGPLSVVPYIAADHAGRVTCPVFIGLGERDSTMSAHHEPTAYTSSSDVTLFILHNSAHCHNSASSRHALWDRIDRWVSTLPDR